MSNRRIVLLIGVVLIALGAFGVHMGNVSVTWLGMAVSFASWLIE